MTDVYEAVRVCEVASERGFHNPDRAERDDGHLAAGQRCIIKGRDTDYRTFEAHERGHGEPFDVELESVYVHELPEAMTGAELVAYLDDDRKQMLLQVDKPSSEGLIA